MKNKHKSQPTTTTINQSIILFHSLFGLGARRGGGAASLERGDNVDDLPSSDANRPSSCAISSFITATFSSASFTWFVSVKWTVIWWFVSLEWTEFFVFRSNETSYRFIVAHFTPFACQRSSGIHCIHQFLFLKLYFDTYSI